ncbi:MAG: hypothetical protein HYY91_01330 [Candidatus Omnitrophica bacterium]|nr:hypothetical protein [Candidatus Omnitrophota bacterium]
MAACVSGCAAASPRTPHAGLLAGTPAPRKQSIGWHLFDVTVLSQVEQLFHLVRVTRRLTGSPLAAKNLRGGQVPDSSFFTNRDIARVTPAEVRAGPTQSSERATPPFLITRIKEEGKTAGFFVTDAEGQRFLFKLDAAGYPELVTGAEVAASKLLHLLGYYVPSYEIVEVAADDLSVSTQVDDGEEELHEALEGRIRNGRLRVSASRILDGEILGPFRFKDHRDCAEIRALKIAYAWLNNTDAKDHNTLMVRADNRVIGYLIDFGTSFGADAQRGAKRPCQGWLYDVDLMNGTLELLTLGLYDRGCKTAEAAASPALGTFSARFDPRGWKPYAPNLAFEELTGAEARWMAARLARLSHEQLAAAVAAGQYHDPQDAARIVEVLEARRNAIVEVYR